MSKAEQRQDWADDEEDDTTLPLPQRSVNKDGSETIISFRMSDDGKKTKITQRIRRKTVRRVVERQEAERRTWGKFGREAGRPGGPQSDTTSVHDNIVFRPVANWRAMQTAGADGKGADGAAGELGAAEAGGSAAGGAAGAPDASGKPAKDSKIKCRICTADHYTMRCPFKDTMAPEGESGIGLGGSGADGGALGEGGAGGEGGSGGGGGGGGGMGAGSGSYIAPHLRKGGAAAAGPGDKMKFERDDLATLRVTNVSDGADEQDLRDMFERFGRVTRVFLARDRETGRAKGFAFVSYSMRDDAQKACDKMDGFGFHHLILRVEFAKKST